MNITEKLLQARKMIKETSVTKEGKNTFSKYDYFTPSQVSQLVNDVCQELKILPLFSLKKNEFGLYGELSIRDLEGNESVNTIMFTEMPSITATNMTQQMGGCETYTKRYMLMSAFDITDNNLDFDSQDNRPKKQPDASKEEVEKVFNQDNILLELECCITQPQLDDLWKKLNNTQQTTHQKAFTTKKELISK